MFTLELPYVTVPLESSHSHSFPAIGSTTTSISSTPDLRLSPSLLIQTLAPSVVSSAATSAATAITNPSNIVAPVSPLSLTTGLNTKRVLVVDDNTVIRKIVTRILTDAGQFVVSEATNGEEAVKLAKDPPDKQPFDIILMDLSMPIMDGFTASRVMREAGITTPIIALTAQATDVHENAITANNMQGFMFKVSVVWCGVVCGGLIHTNMSYMCVVYV
jgi:CheY-like chemotaxis protein